MAEILKTTFVSVSGGGPYRRPDQEPDLLMFDEMQARNNDNLARQPSSSLRLSRNVETVSIRSAPELPPPLSASSLLDTPPSINDSLLIPGIYEKLTVVHLFMSQDACL
jgi:hypothetical protein